MTARAAAGPASLLARAVRLLARREHSRAELARKLAQARHGKGPPSDPVDPVAVAVVLDELEHLGLLSDARFATQRARQRSERYGNSRLRHELQQKGVAAPVAMEAIEALTGTEHQRALALWQRRFGQLAQSPSERARQGRFLQARGFSMDTIRRVLSGRGIGD